jgi:phospholipase/carboxylesterase
MTRSPFHTGFKRGAQISRREFAAIGSGVFASAAFGHASRLSGMASGETTRINARPIANVMTSAAGERALGLGDGRRDAILHVPAKPSGAPIPLLVLLHGAGSDGARLLRRLGASPDESGVAVLAPDSRAQTWDAIRGGFGPDVTFINRALESVFRMVAVDPERIAVGGFSDGATYALSLGLINGDLFRRVVAFSPGFLVDGASHGQPRFFISHGRADDILPIDRCSRRIVQELRRRGHDVAYHEFDGGHEMPPAVVSEAMAWVAAM